MKIHQFLCALASIQVAAIAADRGKFADSFDVPKSDLSPTGSSACFILQPGFVSVFEGKEDGKQVVLTITVTKEVKMVAGVKTRVVEEKETADGEVKEISRNYFAISKKTGDVYYFGEDSATYRDGKVSDRGGSWLCGERGAKFGLALPGTPRVGMAYYQELAPLVAMDRAEIVSVTASVTTPAGKFKNCVKVKENTPLELGSEYKLYAPGIGLVQDGALKLAKYTIPAK